jgi:hypothetical protein
MRHAADNAIVTSFSPAPGTSRIAMRRRAMGRRHGTLLILEFAVADGADAGRHREGGQHRRAAGAIAGLPERPAARPDRFSGSGSVSHSGEIHPVESASRPMPIPIQLQKLRYFELP